MIVSKKQSYTYNSSRHNSKKPENQVSLSYTHRYHESGSRNQSAHVSLRNSQEKILKLRGSSKNVGIKMVSQQKVKQQNGNSIQHSRKPTDIDISRSKKYLQDSSQSLVSSIHFVKQVDSSRKESSRSKPQDSFTFSIAGSFSKPHKESKYIIEPARQLERKKSSHKGLNLTKRASNQTTSLIQGYENSSLNSSIKPNSTRVDKPLAQNYLVLNLNQGPTKSKEAQKKNKLSIDFDSYFNRCKQYQEKKKEVVDNFYSQRNSVSNFYQSGSISYQTSKQKINPTNKYGTIRIEKKTNDQSKKLEIKQVLNSLASKQKQRKDQNITNNSYKSPNINVSNLQKSQNQQKQPIKSQRINNYMEEISDVVQNNHKKILSILQKGPDSKLSDRKDKQKKLYDNCGSISTQETFQKLAKQKKTINEIIRYSPNSFTYDYVVGKGGFGKVWKVYCKRTNGVYALKEMSKALIISKKSVPSVMNEQQLLKDLKNPFLVNMIQSFQTRENLYLLMDYLSGGDLRHHLAVKKYFTEDQTKFIIICILLGLKYLRENQIIHRDIKPQNIVMDEKGYARITDLGVARKWRENNASDTSGTPGYMAPEVLCRQNHSYEVDYFAVGVITYQMMLRKRPYYGRSRKEIRDQVLAKQVQIKRQDIPDGWSLQSADFINRMIQRKPSNRLGFNGIDEIFSHPWLKNTPVQRVQQKKKNPPYVSQKFTKKQSEGANYTSSEDTEIKELIAQNQIILRQKQVQNLFEGYQNF